MERPVGWGMSDVAASSSMVSSRELRRSLAHLSWVAIDIGLIYLAFALAHWLRYDVQLGRDIYDPASYKELSAFNPLIG
ncbi:MAG TPA: hypothetical protein VD886_04635, partial [Herpetosiphonaceae bacterium]|nr:hypothetical protein [Herpetosiphonaceae bacterium]